MSEVSPIVDRDEYLKVRSHVAAVFRLDIRLPNQVFAKGAEDSLFCEFDAVLAPDFWPALCTMARWHGDKQIELLVLEPEREEFYLPEYGMYPAISLPVDAGMDGYWAAIGYEPGGDIMGSIAVSANVIAVTGPSGSWGCWGERDPEIAVSRGFPSVAARTEWGTRFGPFLEVAGALESYLPLTFAGRTVPNAYAEALTVNYGPTGGARR